MEAIRKLRSQAEAQPASNLSIRLTSVGDSNEVATLLSVNHVSCRVSWLLAFPEEQKSFSRQSLCDALVFAPETGRFPGPSCAWAVPVVWVVAFGPQIVLPANGALCRCSQELLQFVQVTAVRERSNRRQVQLTQAL